MRRLHCAHTASSLIQATQEIILWEKKRGGGGSPTLKRQKKSEAGPADVNKLWNNPGLYNCPDCVMPSPEVVDLVDLGI